MSKHSQKSTVQLRGKLLAYNLSPKGHIEGVMVETTTGLAQVNFPKRYAERMARGMVIGTAVDLAVCLEHDGDDHPVYVMEAGEGDRSARGTIVRLNYSLHGEMNGCHLDDGTFVHLKPGRARAYDLQIGATITATGSRRPGADFDVLNAKDVSTPHHRSAPVPA